MHTGEVLGLSAWDIKYVLVVKAFHALRSCYPDVEPDAFR